MTDTNESEKKPKPGKLEGPPRVVIFGAGITGLTAAHELVERGWEVTVVEPEIDPFNVDQCALGGMAKTQWGVYQADHDRAEQGPKEALPLLPTIRLRLGKAEPETKPTLDNGSRIYLDRFLKRLEGIKPFAPSLLITYRAEGQLAFAGELKKELEAVRPSLQIKLGMEDALPPGVWQIQTNLTGRQSAILPGEHGFRFFPALYRHLFDTLRRIPVRGENESFADAYRSVYDNLVPTEANWMALDDDVLRPGSKSARTGTVVCFPRRLRKSLRDHFDAINDMYTELGYTARDIQLLMLRLFKYMTSCRQRRNEQYEGMSWFDFMGLSDLSKAPQQDMVRAPQVLASMTAKDSDARTQGNLATQLLLDPINADERVDSTLNGPTSVAWFQPWRDYLVSQGVAFVPGRLTGFQGYEDRGIRPVVDGIGAALSSDANNYLNDADYYVLAVPIHAWVNKNGTPTELLGSWRAQRPRGAESKDHLERLQTWALAHYRDKLCKDLTGIQYYFDSDTLARSGHTLYMDSAWRLSAISQASFWSRRREPLDGYRGLISVDVGTLHESDPRDMSPMTFWDTPRQDVHVRVWAQMSWRGESPAQEQSPGSSCKSPGDWCPAKLPYRIYHLDENLEYKDGNSRVENNRLPFLINGVGEWDARPGWFDYQRTSKGKHHQHSEGFEPKSGPAEERSSARYQLMPVFEDEPKKAHTRWVLAGTFMQTWTRATTMESANESARHAVNTLLDDAKDRFPHHHAQPCRIWNPEEYEHPDLRIWQELDEKLYGYGNEDEPFPHMIDILELDRLPDELLERGGLSDVIRQLASRLQVTKEER